MLFNPFALLLAFLRGFFGAPEAVERDDLAKDYPVGHLWIIGDKDV